MSRCRASFGVMVLLPLASLPMAQSADEPKPVTIKGTGFESLAFSPDGKTLAVATGFDGVELREAATGKRVTAFSGYRVEGGVVFSSDGAMLAATGYDFTIRVRGLAKSASFRERTLAALEFEETVRIWDVKTGQAKVHLHDVKQMERLAFSPDGKMVAAVGHKSPVRIWNIATEKLAVNWDRGVGEVTVIAFTPDGTKLAVGTRKGPIYLVDTVSGKTPATLDEHLKPVLALAFSPDGKVLHSAGSNGAVRRWDLSTRKAELTPIKHYTEFTRMVFSPDARFVASGDDRGGVTVWDVVTGERYLDFEGHGDATGCLAFSPDGKSLASGANPRLFSSSVPLILTIQPVNLPAKK